MERKKKEKGDSGRIIKILVVVLVFWIADFGMHFLGVGESNYYYLSKFGNAILFAVIFFFIFNYERRWKRFLYSVAFGTWISFYYLISSYSGLVQFFGISARYSAPPFVIGDLFLTPYLWWVFHILAFFVGLEIAGVVGRD